MIQTAVEGEITIEYSYCCYLEGPVWLRRVMMLHYTFSYLSTCIKSSDFRQCIILTPHPAIEISQSHWEGGERGRMEADTSRVCGKFLNEIICCRRGHAGLITSINVSRELIMLGLLLYEIMDQHPTQRLQFRPLPRLLVKIMLIKNANPLLH